MFKKFRNGPYDAIITNHCYFCVSEQNRKPDDSEYLWSTELVLKYPNIKLYASFITEEYGTLDSSGFHRITKEEFRKKLHSLVFTDRFESKLKD